MRWILGVVIALGTTPAYAQPPVPPLPVVVRPHWIALPDMGDLTRVWPHGALNQSGYAQIGCTVTSSGFLEKCHVLVEAPEGVGFGKAALALAPRFRLAPQTVDGVPVGGAEISIPIRWRGTDPVHYSYPPPPIAQNVVWSATPSAAAMAAAFPAEAKDRAVSGHVVLHCSIALAGNVTGCRTISESPRFMGFSAAATRLSRDFQVDTPRTDSLRIYDVEIPFDFHDPRDSTKKVASKNPAWIEAPDPSSVSRLFPEEAAKMGLQTGVGEAACDVTYDGELANCKVTAEYPPGVGFGAAALAVSRAMRMNPWTKEGEPVEGSRITVPFRINLQAQMSGGAGGSPPRTP